MNLMVEMLHEVKVKDDDLEKIPGILFHMDAIPKNWRELGLRKNNNSCWPEKFKQLCAVKVKKNKKRPRALRRKEDFTKVHEVIDDTDGLMIEFYEQHENFTNRGQFEPRMASCKRASNSAI